MSAKRFREFTSPSGYRVLVGKNDKANDELTFGIADPDDLCFHISEVPGPHVVMQWTGVDSPSREDIEFAAGLAIKYSKAAGKNKSNSRVDYCSVRDLKRTKTLGLVVMSKHISICV
jgi:predicted ribosome quality control (RQC) complex YloA/Tae2 family protein